MEQDFLSDIELYFTSAENVKESTLAITGDECKHITRVMRHQPGDKLFVTDGSGSIFETEINSAAKSEVICEIKNRLSYKKQLPNVVVCIPRLRSQDRFEFALEKCIELGITEFIVYTAERSVAKGEKLERWNKIALSAMKQSLRSFLPNIGYKKSLSELLQTENNVLYFDQKSELSVKDKINELKENEVKTLLIFGPEGGLSEKEFNILKEKGIACQLTSNRLRAETAIVTAVSVISV
ncbi:MAG: 16S rRNA (uracil(1498)-N(3))-methyltransferase [Rhodothermaceae bacterium]